MNEMPYLIPQNRWTHIEWSTAAKPNSTQPLLEQLLLCAQQCGCVRWIILPKQPDRLYLYWLNAKLHPEVQAFMGSPSALVENGPYLILVGISALTGGDEAARLAAFQEAYKHLRQVNIKLNQFALDGIPLGRGGYMYPFTGHPLSSASEGGCEVTTGYLENDRTMKIVDRHTNPFTATDLANREHDWRNQHTLELTRRKAWLRQCGENEIIEGKR